ncbi:MAG TPA: SRPBCC family protein [Streptosporangiaceae bacterium]|jgi:carbon monoxide dehydrogenase subunit G
MADRTSSSITVDAATADVMAVIADFSRYPEWADGIKEATVVAGDGDRAGEVRFTLDAGVIRDTYSLAYTWSGDEAVEWDLAQPGAIVSGMSGAYRLTTEGPRTRVVYELAVDVKIPMPGLLRRKAEKTIIGTALKGLKNRVESGH